MYQGAAGVTPACFHSACSRMCVPDLSPRETKRAPAAAIFANAATARFSPPILAGSASGPTTMKSLYMTSRRSWSLPSSTYFFSREGAWTRTTSASPRAARASAWPVPTDAVFTVRPACRSKIGTRTSSRPESCVLVVVDRMTVRDAGVCAAPAATPSTMTKRAAAIRATCALCLKKHNWGPGGREYARHHGGASHGQDSLRGHRGQRRSDARRPSLQLRARRHRGRAPPRDLPRGRGRLPHEIRRCGGRAARRDADGARDARQGDRARRTDLRLREVLRGPWGHRERPEAAQGGLHQPQGVRRKGRGGG